MFETNIEPQNTVNKSFTTSPNLNILEGP